MYESKIKKTEFKPLRFKDMNEAFIENSPTFCVAIEENGKLVKINKVMLEALGYREEEVIGRDYILTFIPRSEHALLKILFDKHVRNRESLITENTVLAKDGRELKVEWHAGPVIYDDGGYAYHLGIGIDITQRKLIENALRESERNLRVISARLRVAEEKERNRISRELHDELGQALSILKLNIGAIMKKLGPDQEALRHGCEKMRGHIDDIIDNVRRLAHDLSPAIVEDLGLDVALRELITSMSRHYQVDTTLSCQELNDLFSAETKIALYRMFQESLNNIVKHAHAARITIFIERRNEQVVFRIEDNGIGFTIPASGPLTRTKRGLGLAAITERVKTMGGTFAVHSTMGKGTSLTYAIPVKKEEPESDL